MGNLVFQATLGGQVNLVGPNTASTFNLNVPATSSTIATLTGTETFTNKTLTTPVISSLSSASATALTLQSAGTTAITVDTSQNTTFAKSIILSGSTSGTTTLASTAVAGTSTATFPAATGTVMVSGNMPAFSAYATAATTITNATWTKLTFDVETFDTNNNFASSRFTPTVAGYYQLSASWQSGFVTSFGGIQIYKNGSSYQYGSFIPATTVGTQVGMSNLVYCNGTTDYVEVYAYQATGLSQNTTVTGINTTWFSGAMVRTA